MTFPQVVGTTMQGFEGDAINFRRALATDDMPDGHFLEAPMRKLDNPVAPRLTPSEFKWPHQGRQHLVSGYTYLGFCKKDEPPEPRSAAQAESDHRALQKIERAVSGVMAAIEDGLYEGSDGRA
jgi:hypothetical protein